MVVTIVSVYVKDGMVDDFIRATIANHQASVLEPGNLRFDFLQDKADSRRFVLYEAYADEASAAAHKDTAHYREWRSAVEPMMAEPRHGRPFIGIKP